VKYRKKPVVVEAIQYCGNGEFFSNQKPPAWLDEAVHAGTFFEDADDGNTYIRTLEGDMVVSPDDWIIKGIKGEIYSCKPDIFAEIYEEVK